MTAENASAATERRLWCARLTLTDFRSHASLDLTLDQRPVCLFGPNGAGKTNILEALTTLSPGRSLRNASAVDLARANADPARARLWAVAATLESAAERIDLGVGADRSPDGSIRRVVRLDGEEASASELGRAIRMTWVTPTMDRLFSGPASDRRKFFDRLTLARTPSHGRSAAAYERAMRERQRLLEEQGDPVWIDGLEEQMALHGAAIAANRARLLDVLQAEIATRPLDAFPKAVLTFEGVWETMAVDQDREAALRVALRQGRRRDAAAGRCLDGPHRSDLMVRHQPKDMPAELCSTGEQKALLLGIMLAHARALAQDALAGPNLVLLDEAAAHLDPDRRAALYDALWTLPGQSWLTGTEPSLFAAFNDRAQHIAIG